MVQRRKLIWRATAPGAAGEPETKTESFSPPVPPVVLMGAITADAFWDSLFGNKLVEPIQSFIAAMRRKSRTPLSLREHDEDSKNSRMMAHEALGRNL